MLNNEEYKNWHLKLGYPEETIQIINRVRESEPSRRVGGGKKNVVGAYPSKKMGMTIAFESHTVELPGLRLKQHDDRVKEMYDQPPAIKLNYKSPKEKVISIYHTPDYFVLYEDCAGWEEWKTEEELCELAEKSPNRYIKIEGKWHCPPGEEYAKQYGLNYWLRSSAEINWQLERNLNFLEDYILDTETNISFEIVNSVKSYVRNNPGLLLINLLQDKDVETDDIYYMIARNNIYVDIEQELLSEPEYTRVFIDEESAVAYKTLNSTLSIPTFTSSSVYIEPGTKILWDGNPWIIMNLGEKDISLISDVDKRVIDIPKEQFYNLISKQQIKSDNSERADKVGFHTKFIEASEKDLIEANKRYKILLPILEGVRDKLGNTGVDDRTIRRWIKSYREAEEMYGAGFIGLIPEKRRGNCGPHLPEEVLVAVNDFLDIQENVKDQSINVLYGKLYTELKEKGLDAPSIKTFGRIIKSRDKYTRILKTQGSRAAYEYSEFYWNLDLTVPRHGERIFDVAHIDHTELDIELVDSKTGENLGRPWLSLMMDAHPRRVLAFYISFNAPSYRSDMMLIRECVRRFNRLPQTIITDGGRDLKSTYFDTLLALYGVTKKLRPPHKSRFGSVIERVFGTTMKQLIHNLQGNSKIMKNVRKVTKSVNPKCHAVWTLPALYELLTEYFYEFYDTNDHSALGESPRSAFERSQATSGKRPYRFISYNEEFLIMTCPAVKRNEGTAKVDAQRGVKVNYFYYWNELFNRSGVAETRVKVRYDPWNIGMVYCYIRGKWAKCYSDYYSVLKNRTENEIKIISQELYNRNKNLAGKYKLKAKEIADFIIKAEETEELLKQRQFDAEMIPQLRIINGYKEDDSEKIEETIYITDIEFDKKIDFDLDDGYR